MPSSLVPNRRRRVFLLGVSMKQKIADRVKLSYSQFSALFLAVLCGSREVRCALGSGGSFLVAFCSTETMFCSDREPKAVTPVGLWHSLAAQYTTEVLPEAGLRVSAVAQVGVMPVSCPCANHCRGRDCHE